MASLYGHIRELSIAEVIDQYVQDASIEPTDEVADVITRGTADSIEPVGPIAVDITLDVQYPAGGGSVDYWELMIRRSTFRCSWTDYDGKEGAARNCRVTAAPRSDPLKGERKQQVKIHGYLVDRPAEA